MYYFKTYMLKAQAYQHIVVAAIIFILHLSAMLFNLYLRDTPLTTMLASPEEMFQEWSSTN